MTIDGADDVDLALNAIKGGGACHLREKVLAEAADEFVIVADYRKNNILLGDVSPFPGSSRFSFSGAMANGGKDGLADAGGSC